MRPLKGAMPSHAVYKNNKAVYRGKLKSLDVILKIVHWQGFTMMKSCDKWAKRLMIVWANTLILFTMNTSQC